jgi:ABC-type Fe3+ transport system permease subunit
MWALTVIPLLATIVTALLAWHHASRVDREQSEGWPRNDHRDHPAAWPLVLGSLVIAVAAATMLQVTVLAGLGLR